MHFTPQSWGSPLREFNKCHAPADGKFCSGPGLGLTSTGKPLKPFDFWAKTPDELPDPPDTPVGMRVGTTSPGHESWRVDWYSFPKGGAYEAKQLGSFPVKAIRMSDYKDEGNPAQSRHLEQITRNRGLVAPPGYMLIYRLGAPGEKSIAGRNGANADGLVNFVDRTNEDLIGTGDTIYVYAVKLRKPLGSYREYRGFREFNPCHSEADGKFCSTGGGQRTVDERGVTRVGGFVELYHGTSARRANKIALKGFGIRAVRHQTMGGDSESNRNYIWFAKSPEGAKNYAEMHLNPVVVTVRIPEKLFQRISPDGHNSGPDAVWSPESIPAKYIHSISRVARGLR